MKIFIAGPRAVSKLNTKVTDKLKSIADNNYTVLVGDANGIDKTVQKFYNDRGYEKVIVYVSGERVRNNIGNWETKNIEVNDNVKGFDFYTVKDKEMAKQSDYGLMIWNGKSRGTFNNIINLISFKKTVLLYFIPNKQFYKLKSMDDIQKIVEAINNKDINEFLLSNINKTEQLTLDTTVMQ